MRSWDKEMIASLPNSTCSDEDIKVIESRTIKDDHPGYPNDALHVYPRNNHVDDQNKLKLH